MGSKNVDLFQEWLLESTLQSHPCLSAWMHLAGLCKMLFPRRVLPSAGMWNLNLCSIMFDLKISLITRANSLKTIQTTEIQYILSFDLVNVVPCSVKKTTVTGCPCRSETYCNGGHWRTCQDGVFGLTGSLDRWKHKQKPWNLDDFNEEPNPPPRALAKSFGARCISNDHTNHSNQAVSRSLPWNLWKES